MQLDFLPVPSACGEDIEASWPLQPGLFVETAEKKKTKHGLFVETAEKKKTKHKRRDGRWGPYKHAGGHWAIGF